MNGGTIGSWRAQRVLLSGAETEVGIIPNKCRYCTQPAATCIAWPVIPNFKVHPLTYVIPLILFSRAEQLAIAQDLEAKKGPNTKAKSGTLKRKDTKSQTPKKKQYQAADQLDETSFRKSVIKEICYCDY